MRYPTPGDPAHFIPALPRCDHPDVEDAEPMDLFGAGPVPAKRCRTCGALLFDIDDLREE